MRIQLRLILGKGRTTALVALLLALAVPAIAQNRPDDDIPVLKRRPPASQTNPQAPPEQAPSTQPPAPPLSSSGPQDTAPPPTAPIPHDHHADVMRHGAQAMGFSQEATTHRFTLTRSGGVVRVTVNDPDDAQTVGRVNVHFRTIASQFARGDFRAPELTHGRTPPGVETMQRLRNKIIYTAHAIAGGAELIISSSDQRAVEAIHQFLRFQIQDHQTGDSPIVR